MRTLAADRSAELLRANVLVELEPDRAFAILEREDEFATRATCWELDT